MKRPGWQSGIDCSARAAFRTSSFKSMTTIPREGTGMLQMRPPMDSKDYADSPVRAVLFDVDGTLADTERDGHRLAFNAAFKESGLDWDWSVELYGELLAITGGKERIRHFMEKYTPA